MSKVRFELNEEGVRELLQGAAMQSLLGSLASQKAAQAGSGYKSAVHVFTRRAVAHIFPGDAESAHDNYENNTLLKTIGG